MSGDLISRSRLLEMLNYNKAINEDNAKGKIIVVPVDEIIKYVEKMPVAYNLDKVVEQLEEKALEHAENGHQYGTDGWCNQASKEYAVRDAYYEAIELVKAGGVE